MDRRGLTLIEIIIGISIFVALIAVSANYYGGFILEKDLDSSAKMIMSDLRTVQAKAIAGVDNSDWGLCLANIDANNNYYGYVNSSASCPSSGAPTFNSQSIYLPSDVVFADPSIGTNKFILFFKAIGSSISGGNEVIKIVSGDKKENIIVSSQGRVYRSSYKIITGSATSVTSSGAILHGTVNANESAATTVFRYSSTNPGACNSSFGVEAAGISESSAVDVNFSTAISVSANTTYYYCAIANGPLGEKLGDIVSFSTPSS